MLSFISGKRQRKDAQTYVVLFGVVIILAVCHALRIFWIINLLVSVSSSDVQARFQIIKKDQTCEVSHLDHNTRVHLIN